MYTHNRAITNRKKAHRTTKHCVYCERRSSVSRRCVFWQPGYSVVHFSFQYSFVNSLLSCICLDSLGFDIPFYFLFFYIFGFWVYIVLVAWLSQIFARRIEGKSNRQLALFQCVCFVFSSRDMITIATISRYFIPFIIYHYGQCAKNASYFVLAQHISCHQKCFNDKNTYLLR